MRSVTAPVREDGSARSRVSGLLLVLSGNARRISYLGWISMGDHGWTTMLRLLVGQVRRSWQITYRTPRQDRLSRDLPCPRAPGAERAGSSDVRALTPYLLGPARAAYSEHNALHAERNYQATRTS